MVPPEMLTRGRSLVKMNSTPQRMGALRWLPAVLWMGGIFYLSQQSSPLGVDAGASRAALAHVVLFCGLAAFLYWPLAGRSAQVAWAAMAISFALAVLYGVTDELHQAFVDGRVASETDLLFDAGGALAGVAAAALLRLLLRRLQ